MSRLGYQFQVEADSQAVAVNAATALADLLRETDGVFSAERGKANSDTMDLGSVVSVLADSRSTLALAIGLAAWLKARRNTKVVINYELGSERLKVVVSNIDADAASRIIETAFHG